MTPLIQSGAFGSILDFLVHRRDYFVGRLEACRAWFLCLSIISLLVSISIGVALSLCAKTGLLFGVELGVLCALPLLFVLWLPFLLTMFIVEITKTPETQLELPSFIPTEPDLSATDVDLPNPFIPPRLSFA